MSNRSFHLANRFQTMISAIRAAPPRVLFLAVAVAVVGLMTVTDLPSASPVHAQEQAVTATRDATGESPPARPTDLQASAGPDSVSLTWTASTDQTVTHYAVLLRDRDEDDAGVFEVIDSNAGSATSYTDGSVSPGGSYVYRVKAVSPTGVSQWSSYARADIPADPEDLAPSGLSAKAVFDGGDSAGVALSWDAPAADAASVTGYEILRAVGDGDLATLVADTGSADTTYADGTATEAGERYAYRVKALRGEETSQPSDQAVVSIPKVTVLPVEPRIAERQSGDARVPSDWGLIPSGLSVGDRFRLIFISSGTLTGTATDIADYNTFVQNAAANGHADIQRHSSAFLVVGSTADTDARDNTATRYTGDDTASVDDDSDLGVAIYWLDGNKVADQYRDFYDGDWDDEANAKDESGTARSTSGAADKPFTGSGHDGTEAFSSSISRALGATQVTTARPNEATGGPLSSGATAGNSNARPIYGLSEVFLIVLADADATLSALSLSDSMLSPSFAADTLTYTGSVRNVVSLTTVTATPNDDGATVVIVPADADDVTDGHQVALPLGDTVISVTVTSEDRGTTQTYAVSVTRAEAQEEAVTTVPADWVLTPSGLGAGDRFRLLFLSSGTRDAIPIAIADYDTWIQNLAANGHADIQQYSSTFRVVGSTAVVDARDNTNTTYTNDDKGVAIYWLGGNKVADDYEGFYDGEWDDEANAKDQSGNNRSPSGSTNRPFTGSGHDGTESFNSSNASRALGASIVRLGRPTSAGHGPLSSGSTSSNSTSRPLYGLSGVFVVGAEEQNEAVWSATFTPTSTGGNVGCVNQTDEDEETCVSRLTDSSFDYDSTTYTVAGLLLYIGELELYLDPTPTAATIADLTLNIGGSPFPLSSATGSGSPLSWANSGLTWIPDSDSISVSLTEGAAAPAVSDVDVTSEPGDDDTYAIGDTIQVTVTFDQPVTVTGTPRIQLRVGGGEDEHLKWADYFTGTGAAVLHFTYVVLAGDFDDNGIDIAADELELNGGTIQSSDGTDANLDYPDQGAQSGHNVDGVRPTPEFAVTSDDGDSIIIIFSETLSATTAAASAFTLSVNPGTAPAVRTATASGDKVTLGLGSALTSGQVVTVTYVDATLGDDAAAVQDTAGNDAANFTTGQGSVSAVVNAVGTGCSIADGCYVVPADWGLIPSGLGAGAEFRLIFISSGTRDGQSTDIADYNTFVQNAAAAGHADIQSYSSVFRVVGSTGAVYARDNTATRYTGDDTPATDDDSELGVPIYWLNGNKVADEYRDFYDEGWDDEANAKDESGNNRSTSGTANYPLTGSLHQGTGFSVLGGSFVRVGRPNSTISNAGPLSSDSIVLSPASRPLYGLSLVFRVEGQVVTNTAPAFTTVADFSTNENEAISFQVTAMDADAGDEVTYAVTGGADLAHFQINATTGLLAIPFTLDHENPEDADSNNVYLVTVTATGGTGARALTTDQDITVTVLDVDEPPSAPAAPTVSAVSGSSDSLSVTWTAPGNSGKPDIQSYDLQYRKGTTGNFADGPQDVTGTSATIGGLDADSLYQVQVRATNEDGDSAWSSAGSGTTNASAGCGTLPTDRLWSACLTVGEINAAGRYGYQAFDSTGSLAPATFDVGTTTYTVTHLFDNDNVGGNTYVRITLSPTLSQDDAGNLTLHLGDDTSLSFGDATYVTVSGDSRHQWFRTAALGWSTGNAIVVGITQEEQVNTPPSFQSESATREVAENSAAGSPVGGPVTATDTDDDTLTYTLEGTDAASFGIDASSGQIQTKTGVTYNYEATPSYTVTVKADDGNGGTDTIAVTINITDVDEPPSAPDEPTVSAVNGTSDRLSVSWTRPDDTGIPFNFSYDLQYRKGTIGDFTDGPQNVIGLTATIHGLDADSAYQVRVRATNDEGDSGWSSAGSGTTYAQTPPPDAYFLTGPALGTYAIDGTLSFTVDFSAAVTVSGTPQLALDIGGETRQADYASGSGTESLLFSYTVAEDDEDTEGIGVPADSLTLNGGAITAITADGLAATLSLSRFSLGGVLVDGVRPIPEFAATSVDGNSVFIIFSESLSATTAPASAFTLSVDTGTAPTVSTATASGDKVTLALASALTSGQAVTVAYIDPTLGNDAAAVQDAAGNDAANFTRTVSNAVGTGCSIVAGCYLVSADWRLIPSGLAAGAEFRLLFISSGTRDGASSDIADYNGFVQTAAASGHADIQQYSSTFRVVGSTAAVDARDNTATTYTDDDKGVAIYWLGGNKVADEYEDFYDETWDDEANAKDESGSDRSTSLDPSKPITGSDHNGTESFSGLSSRALGASNVRVGRPNSSTSGLGPLSSNFATGNSNARPLYGLSPVFRVEGQVVTNTAPAFTTSAAFSTNENQAATFQVTAMDPDDGDEVTYAITGGADQAKFDIGATSGVLTFKDAPDHENPTDADGNNVYLVTVTATGGTGARALTADQAITVTVTAVDEIWSATMTVGVNSTLLGWDDAGNYIGSALSDEDFDYGGDTYNLSIIRLASGSLIVIFNDTGAGDLATAATRDKLTLHVDGTTFNFGAGNLNAAQTGVAWSAGGLTWSDGDTVELKITVSEDAEVALTSDPGADDTYAIGDAIEATATFGQAVTVTGTPQIEMQVGGETRTADYASGSGSTNLVFSYTVVEGDLDADGVAVELGLIDLNGGTILVGTTAAGLIHGAVSASTDHKVDGVRPIFVSAETSVDGTRLFATFSEPISEANVNSIGLASGQVHVTLIEIDGAVVELDPSIDFAHDTMWRIDFGVGAVRDMAGNPNARSSNNPITNNVLAVCGTLPTDRLWSACLTVGQFGDGDVNGYQGSPSIGTLAPATFDVGTTTYTVTHFFRKEGSGAYVRIILSPILSQDDAGNLTLHLGDDASFSFADATYSTGTGISRHEWSLSTALDWTVGDAIVVGITQEEQANAAPSFLLESATREVAENSAAGVDVGDPVTAIDTDTGDTLTYTLEGTDAASFTIVSTSGQIRTETGVTYDHELQPEYSVTVKADDGNGGTDTIAVTIDIADVDEPPSPPAAPTVSAVSGTTDSLSVTWTAPDNRGRPAIQSYNLQYRKGTTGNFADGPQNETGTTATIDGLDPGVEYQVQVRATNDEGDSAWSSAGSGTTNEPTDPTDADNLTATAHTGKIRLEWMGSADAYEFRRKEDGGAWSPSWTAAETRGWFVLRNATTLDDYDVLAETTYTYQVRVAGDAGNLGEDSATLGPPITLRLDRTAYSVDEGAGELFFTVLAETPVGLGRYDRDIRPSFTSAGVVGPLPEGPLVKTQEDYELLIESLRIEPGDFVLVNGMYVASRLRSVGIVDDTLVEGDETFELRLLLAGGVSRFFTLGAGDGRAEVTIVDNDQTSAAPAAGNPLTGFELVDATAHLDAGAVDDGATLTGIDPAKLYGFRANVASGAELKSVRLELSGPGPDDRVARTDNDEPYALHGDSGGHEHGAALAAGSYTLTATAHSEKDGGGSELGTLSVEFTVAGEPLTARFEGLPEGTHGGAGETFAFRLVFSEAVTTTPEALRDHALEVTNAAVKAVTRVDDRSDLWEVRLTPESDAMVTVSLLPAADCDAAGAVCTEDGRMLSFGVARVILGPPPNSPATGQPSISGTAQVGSTLTADTSGIADDDGLDNVTFSYQWVADDANIQGATGSSYTLADRDKGKTIKVIVSFTDDANNEESLPSAATDAVAALPGKPQDLEGEATAQEIELTWTAPTGDAVVEYVVYRGILQNGSMNGQALSKYATIDAAGKDMTYTDDNVEEGVEYRYRVAAVNSDGEGKKSTWLDIRAE